MSIGNKIKRLSTGEPPRVLDLFAGCGGLSLGFQSAGCRILAGVECDEFAAASHGLNFHPTDRRHAVARDITHATPVSLSRELGLGEVSEAVDIVVGGPPCQAFARVGRAKLREVLADKEAFLNDPRAQLYKSYIRYVDEFEPLALLMENVPDMLNHGGKNIAEEVCDVLEARGYVCAYTLLNSVFYGVPQMRERMFLIAYRRELGTREVRFPEPTHWHELPSGYEGSRQVAKKLLNGLFALSHDFKEPPQALAGLRRAVSAGDAIGDLPPIYAMEELEAGRLKKGARRFDSATMAYDLTMPVSDYALEMKTWKGFEAPSGLYDHQIRYLPRDFRLFREMRNGSEYPELQKLAVHLFDKEAQRRGHRRDSKAWNELRNDMVPPYDPMKFPNKWWKLVEDGPVRTLMAHLGKDSYSHIHYDKKQARTISVREAARLQSFPDGFRFCGTMNPAFRQIGNAVPPLLARAVAAELVHALSESVGSGLAERRAAAAAA